MAWRSTPFVAPENFFRSKLHSMKSPKSTKHFPECKHTECKPCRSSTGTRIMPQQGPQQATDEASAWTRALLRTIAISCVHAAPGPLTRPHSRAAFIYTNTFVQHSHLRIHWHVALMPLHSCICTYSAALTLAALPHFSPLSRCSFGAAALTPQH